MVHDPVLINNEIMFIPSKGASLDEISLRNKYHGNTGKIMYETEIFDNLVRSLWYRYKPPYVTKYWWTAI